MTGKRAKNNDRPHKNLFMIWLIRIIHALIVFLFIAFIAVVYHRGITKNIDAWFYIASVAIAIEGILVILNRWDCPLTFIHKRYGDNKGFFGLFMPDDMARHTIKLFAVIAVIGYIIVFLNVFL
jgi:hypothetical protein